MMKNSKPETSASTGMQANITEKLQNAFSPEQLVVENQSANHAGHAGDDGSGESHFAVLIKASNLNELNRIEKERAIHRALGADMQRIHALSIRFI